MSIDFFPSGIETLASNPRLRPAAGDLNERVQAELAHHAKQFAQEREAALQLLQRDEAGESTHKGGSSHIAGVTGSEKALALLADLFAAPTRPTGRSMA